MEQFAEDATQFGSALLSTAPFDRLRAAIDVYRVDVSSKDSGARDPVKCNGTGSKPKTYFDASFCTNGIRRLLVGNSGRVVKVVNKQVPQWHVALLAVNSAIHGGSGGAVPTFSKAPGAVQIALHEMGHSAFGLADEYEYYAGCAIDSSASPCGKFWQTFGRLRLRFNQFIQRGRDFSNRRQLFMALGTITRCPR